MKKSDTIKCAFYRLMTKGAVTRQGKRHTFKDLRLTASTLLASHKNYKFYAQYFLGQMPDNVADKHYVVPNQKEFDRALAWLGKQFDRRR